MGKLKNYETATSRSTTSPRPSRRGRVLNLKQASKKIEKEKSAAKKQTLGKKAKVALKLANRKGGRGLRNPANPDFQKNLQRVRPVFERAEVAPKDAAASRSRKRPPAANFPRRKPTRARAGRRRPRLARSLPARARSRTPTPPRLRPAGQDLKDKLSGESAAVTTRQRRRPPSPPPRLPRAAAIIAAADDAGRRRRPRRRRHARRVALHLRDAAAAHDEPWDAPRAPRRQPTVRNRPARQTAPVRGLDGHAAPAQTRRRRRVRRRTTNPRLASSAAPMMSRFSRRGARLVARRDALAELAEAAPARVARASA